jgi:hypothetical protein
MMALNTQLANASVSVEADALAALMNSGYIDIYSGSQPATADTALGAQTLGVTLTFGATAFGSASNGVITANAITSGVAVASITAAWARIYRSNHTTVVMDVSVGTATANVILPTTTITSGQTVSCSSFTHTVAKATSGA